MKRWPTVLLIVSLALNVFLAGAIAGGIWHWKKQQGFGQRNGWRMHVSQSLPPDQGRAFRQAMKDTFNASLPIVQEGRAARVEAVRLISAPNYDAAAVMVQFDRARAADTKLRANIEARVTQFAASLPQDQRRRLAKALEEGPLRQGPRR